MCDEGQPFTGKVQTPQDDEHGEVFQSIRRRRGIGLDRYRFSVHGKRISMAALQSLGLKDRDRIDCYSLEDRLEDCARVS